MEKRYFDKKRLIMVMLLCWFLTPIFLYGFGIYYEIKADNMRTWLFKDDRFFVLKKAETLDDYIAKTRSLSEKAEWLKQVGMVSGIVVVVGTVAWFFVFPKKKD